MKETLKKLLDFAVIIVAVFATIGGAGHLFADGHILFGIAVLCLAAMAFPYVKKCIKDINL